MPHTYFAAMMPTAVTPSGYLCTEDICVAARHKSLSLQCCPLQSCCSCINVCTEDYCSTPMVQASYMHLHVEICTEAIYSSLRA